MLHKILQACGMGVLGFMFPRMLVGVGVPLDQWATSIGAFMHITITQEAALNTVAVVMAITLIGVELWWRPAGMLISRLFRRNVHPYLAIPSPASRTVGVQVEGSGNVFVNTRSEGFDVGYNLAHAAKDNVFVNTEAQSKRPKEITSLLVAIHRVAFGSWEPIDFSEMDGKTTILVDAKNKVRQWSITGDIVVWGKDALYETAWKQVPKSFWERNQITAISLFRGDPKALEWEPVTGQRRSDQWHDFMVLKEQVEECLKQASQLRQRP